MRLTGSLHSLQRLTWLSPNRDLREGSKSPVMINADGKALDLLVIGQNRQHRLPKARLEYVKSYSLLSFGLQAHVP